MRVPIFEKHTWVWIGVSSSSNSVNSTDVALVTVVVTVVTLGGDAVLNVTTISAVVVRVLETTPTDVNKFGKSVVGNDGLSTDITERSVGVNISSVQTRGK